MAVFYVIKSDNKKHFFSNQTAIKCSNDVLLSHSHQSNGYMHTKMLKGYILAGKLEKRILMSCKI